MSEAPWRPRACIWRDTLTAAGDELETAEVHVLGTLASFGGWGKWCYPGIDTISAVTRLHRRTVVRVIQACEAKGWLLVDRARPGEAQRSNRYKVTSSPTARAIVEEQERRRRARHAQRRPQRPEEDL